MADTVRVPEEFRELFQRAQDIVAAYFAERRELPEQGTIEIRGQRYIQVRAASMSVEFFDLVRRHYSGEREAEGEQIARSLLFDIAHAIGLADAEDFAAQLGLEDPVERLSAGPVHFAHTGWAFVDIHAGSVPSPDDDYFLVYEHPYSFEADAWVRAGRKSRAPVCHMNAGYSSGWCQGSFGQKLVASELLCKGRGDHTCLFVMAPPHRIEQRVTDYLESHPEVAAIAGTPSIPGFFAERRRAEATLHASEERFRGAFEHSSIGIAITDLEGTVLRTNAALATLLGTTVDALEGRSYTEFDTGEPMTADMGEVLGGDRPHLRFERRARRLDDGGVIDVLITVSVTRDAAGNPLHLVAHCEDQTEQKRALAELQQREEQLQRAMRLDAIGRLAGGMAHDFNNLLTVIQGTAEQLGRSLSDGDDARRAAAILEAAERAGQLTQQLLAFSRKQVLQPQVVDPAEVFASVRDMLGRVVSEDIGLSVLVGGDVRPVFVDRTQLEQMFFNLVVNARDAMPDGGRITITIGSPVEGDFVSIEVRDTGRGMDPATRARVFEPFFTTKGEGEGIGLGLASVYGFVQQSGGQIDVRSEPGEGTTFQVLLPVATDAPVRSVPARRPATGGAETVLVVDDNRDILELVGEALGMLGYTIHIAAGGHEAIAVAAGLDHVDLVLSDVIMPDLSGPETAAAVREAHPDARVLFMTGYAESRRSRRRLPDGAVVVNKPFALSALAEQVRAVLDGRT